MSTNSSGGPEEAKPSRRWRHRMHDGLRKIFTNKNREPLAQYRGLQQGYICWIDEPLNWRRVTRRFRLAGWCFSKNGEAIEGLRACIDDRQFTVSHGLARPDVARIHPDQEGALQSGFEVMVEAPSGAGPRPALRSAPFGRLMAGNFQPADCRLAESRWELRGLDQELRHLAVGGPLQNSEANPVFSAQAAVFHPPSGFQLNRRSPKRGDRVRPRAALSGLATSSCPGCSAPGRDAPYSQLFGGAG